MTPAENTISSEESNTKTINTYIICRYAEIGLKGKNRSFFEKRLVDNLKKCLKFHNLTHLGITRPRGRIIIHADTKTQDFSPIKKVFGLSSYSFAKSTEPTIKAISNLAKECAIKDNLNKDKTFRVSTQRMDKQFKFTSQDLDIKIGSFLNIQTGAGVKLKGFDFELGIEVIEGKVFVFTKKIRAFGGLPVGVEGNLYLLLESENDLLAGLLLMKRGAFVFPAKLKTNKSTPNFDLLKSYCFSNLRFSEIDKIEELDKIAKESKVKAIIVGQTIKNISDLKLTTPVLRPLIGLSENEIKEKLNDFKKIA